MAECQGPQPKGGPERWENRKKKRRKGRKKGEREKKREKREKKVESKKERKGSEPWYMGPCDLLKPPAPGKVLSGAHSVL